MEFSQRGLLGLSFGNRVEVYPDPTKTAIVYTYMKHEVFKTVSQIQFCPYEDILGVCAAGVFLATCVLVDSHSS